MRANEFRTVLESVSHLTPTQRSALQRLLQDGSSEAMLQKVLEELRVDGIRCPRCGDGHVIGWGQASGLPRWRCKACKRTFNPLTGTSLARLHYRSTWAEYAESLRQGETLRVASERCAVHINTAHRWRHRFLREPAQSRERLSGIAEADETLELRSFKGQPALRAAYNRLPRKRGGKSTRPGRNSDHVNIFVGRDRSGVTIDRVLDRLDTRSVRSVMRDGLEPDVLLCTDGLRIYRLVAEQLGLRHEVLGAKRNQRVRGPFHIQNVNNYHSRWKGWTRRFNGVSTKYLPSYLGWFRTLDSRADARSAEPVLRAVFAG
jgi:transposase-like protein